MLGLLFGLAIIMIANGCGEEQKTSAFDCDPNAPSLIPASSGKPQHVYFFKDT